MWATKSSLTMCRHMGSGTGAHGCIALPPCGHACMNVCGHMCVYMPARTSKRQAPQHTCYTSYMHMCGYLCVCIRMHGSNVKHSSIHGTLRTCKDKHNTQCVHREHRPKSYPLLIDLRSNPQRMRLRFGGNVVLLDPRKREGRKHLRFGGGGILSDPT